MSRLIFFALLAALAWIWFFKRPRPKGPERPAAAPQQVERVVKCGHCGLRIPEGEALSSGDEHYCSAEHRDAAARRP
jgi:uncharacterized protein